MSRSVPGGEDAAQPVSAAAKLISVVNAVRAEGLGLKKKRLLVVSGIFKAGGVCALTHCSINIAAPVQLLLRAHEAVFLSSHDEPAAEFFESVRIAGVVGVQMGEKHIGILRFKSERCHSAAQRLKALGTVEAAVDEQTALTGSPFDRIAVEPLQRVIRKHYRENINIIFYLLWSTIFIHLSLSLHFVRLIIDQQEPCQRMIAVLPESAMHLPAQAKG